MQLIHKNAPQEALEFFIRYLCIIWFLIALEEPLYELAYLPLSAFEACGLFLKVLPAAAIKFLLSYPMLWALKLSILVVLAGVFFNRLRVPCLIVLSMFLTFYQAYLRSFGHMNHGEIPILYAVYIITAFALADMCLDKDIRRESEEKISLYGLPLVVIAAVLCFSYALVGIHRLVESGLAIFGPEVMVKWILEKVDRTVIFPWDMAFLIKNYPWLQIFFQWGFILVTIFEILAPIALLSRRFRYVFLCVMVPFHILSWMTMEILFWEEMLMFIVFFEWYKQKGSLSYA